MNPSPLTLNGPSTFLLWAPAVCPQCKPHCPLALLLRLVMRAPCYPSADYPGQTMASVRSIFQQCSDEFARRQEEWAREWYRACIQVTPDKDMDAQTSHQTSKVANYELLGPKVPHCFSSLFARRYGLIAATSIHMNSACHAGPRSSRDWASPPPPKSRLLLGRSASLPDCRINLGYCSKLPLALRFCKWRR